MAKDTQRTEAKILAKILIKIRETEEDSPTLQMKMEMLLNEACFACFAHTDETLSEILGKEAEGNMYVFEDRSSIFLHRNGIGLPSRISEEEMDDLRKALTESRAYRKEHPEDLEGKNYLDEDSPTHDSIH